MSARLICDGCGATLQRPRVGRLPRWCDRCRPSGGRRNLKSFRAEIVHRQQARRRWNAARSRALGRLAVKHHAEYLRYLAEERAA